MVDEDALATNAKEKTVKNSKYLLTVGLLSLGLLAGLASTARADDDDWGRVALSVFLGGPVYSAPAYVAPPPPPVEYRYYGPPAPPPRYYYQRHHGWHDHGGWGRHEEDDDD